LTFFLISGTEQCSLGIVMMAQCSGKFRNSPFQNRIPITEKGKAVMKRLLCLVITACLAVSIFWSHQAYAEAITLTEQAQACITACTEQLKGELGEACLTKESAKQHLNVCLMMGKDCSPWAEEAMKAQFDLCSALNDRMCGCGSANRATRSVSKPAGEKEGVFRPTKETVVSLTPREDCERNRHGIWVEVPEKRTEYRDGKKVEIEGVTPICFTLKGAWDEIQALKDRLAKMAPLTQQELDELREVKVICELPWLEEHEARATLEKNGGKYSLTVACKAMRQKILDAEKNAAEAKKDAKQALKQSGEAKKDAKQARATAKDAKTVAQQADAKTNWSLVRLSAIGGIYLDRTPKYGQAGGDFLGFGGGEAAWYPRVAPRLRLVMSAEVGYSSKIYASNSAVVGLGLGLATELATDFIGSAQLFAQHFYFRNEWSKLNVYGIAPGFVWAPGLSKKLPGEAVFALSLDVPIGMGRYVVPGIPGVVEHAQVGARLGLGILF
jgi:hypothetical protein